MVRVGNCYVAHATLTLYPFRADWIATVEHPPNYHISISLTLKDKNGGTLFTFPEFHSWTNYELRYPYHIRIAEVGSASYLASCSGPPLTL